MSRFIHAFLISLLPILVLGQSREHIIRRGENVATISALYGIDERTLLDANPRLNDFCVVGMRLNIPIQNTSNDYWESIGQDTITNLWEQGDFAFNSKDYKTAAKFYQKALDINRSDPLLHYNLGLCYFKREKYKKAVDEFDNCMYYTKDEEISEKAKGLREIAYERLEEERENRKEFWSAIGLVAAGTALAVGSAAVAAHNNQSSYSYQGMPSYSSSGRISNSTLDQIDAYTRQELIRNRQQFYQLSAMNYAIRSQENYKKMNETSWKLDPSNPVNELYMTFWSEWEKDPTQNQTALFASLVQEKYGRAPTMEELQYFQEIFAKGLEFKAGQSLNYESGNDNSISVTQPSSGSRIVCSRCKGTGRIAYETNPPQFGLGDLHKEKCNECGEYFLSSWGHTHITCPQCHGHKYID